MTQANSPGPTIAEPGLDQKPGDATGEPGRGHTASMRAAPGHASPRVRRRHAWRAGLAVCSGLILFVFLSLFVSFARSVATISVPADPRADAIVVLTGGQERISQAISLLQEGRATRLLISGVHPGTTTEQIIKATSAKAPLFTCCVDLDRAALNTAGNASETAAWAQRNGFESLLVVTSAYHLPRAGLELSDTLPAVDLRPYPVYSADLNLTAWYRNPATIRLLMREYVKYTLARLRIAADRLLP